MEYVVYILKSTNDGGYYFGHTKHLDQRLKEHNSGKVRSTKGRRPFVVHYTVTFDSKPAAYQREMFFKSFEGRPWLKYQGII